MDDFERIYAEYYDQVYGYYTRSRVPPHGGGSDPRVLF